MSIRRQFQFAAAYLLLLALVSVGVGCARLLPWQLAFFACVANLSLAWIAWDGAGPHRRLPR